MGKSREPLQTAAEIQAIARTPAFQAAARAYRLALQKRPRDGYLIQQAISDIRERFGPVLAAGLIDWEGEER